MGGYIVQTIAYTYPDFVKNLVISNSVMKTNLCFNLYAEAQLELRKASAPLRSILKASLACVYSANYLAHLGRVDELIELGINYPHAFTLKGYEAQFAALTAFDSRVWASKINARTLVIGSDEDLIFREASFKLLAKTIPNAVYHGFKGVGHIPFIEQPDEFVAVLEDFFA